MSLLGLDVGTTGCKSVVFNEDGEIISTAYKEYPEIYPFPGWVEMNPEVVWTAVKEVIRKSVKEASKDKVKALCPSVLGVSVTPVDKKGNSLYNSITAIDGRCVKQSQFIEEELGKEEIFKETGVVNSATWGINKILWIKENKPQIFKNTYKFLLCEDFIIQKLGLEPKISYSLAGLTMAFNIKNKRWSSLILEAADLDENIFSKPVPSGQIVGEISGAIADDLGLQNKTKVVSGGFDQAMSALGGGLIEDGMSTLCFGTIECITTAFSTFNPDPTLLKYNHPIFFHVLEDLYITIAWCFTAGALLKWYRDNFAYEEMMRAKKDNLDVFKIIVEKSLDSPARVIVLPHFNGSGTPFLDTKSKGAFVGVTLGTSKKELIKAILDSLTYEMQWNIETLEMAGIKVEALNMFGGGAKNDVLPQIKADILQREIRAISLSETGCFGAAVLAGSALGIYKNPQEAIKNIVKPRKIFKPDRRYLQTYKKIYEIYKDLYETLKDINYRLSDL